MKKKQNKQANDNNFSPTRSKLFEPDAKQQQQKRPSERDEKKNHSQQQLK